MKKLVLFVILAMVVSFAIAEDTNFDKLKAAHMNAMKYYGHSNILAEKEHQMVFMNIDNGIASVCYGKEMATAYMEKDEVKYYWHVESVKNGVILSSKANVKGVKYSRSIEVLISNSEVTIRQRPDMDEGSRISCDWGCLAGKCFKCITCMTDWKCWITCAGPGIWECCQF